MGKGGGCFPSKNKRPPVAADDHPRDAPTTPPEDHTAAAAAAPENGANVNANSAIESIAAARGVRIFVVFYSMYGHVEGLAKRMKKGADGVEGVEAVLFRVPETLPAEVLEQMKAPPKDTGIPEITAAELVDADGFLFGFPTRYGCMAAQMKSFFDSTGELWKQQKLAGKPGGFFVSTGTQGGGQETTAWVRDSLIKGVSVV